MNLNNVRHGELKEVFDAMEEAFGKLEIDYYMIGAVAREVWYEKGNKQFRRTKDVDFAVLVSNEKQYDAVRKYLIGNKNFTATRQNAFLLISPAGIQVDILPFGKIAPDGGVQLSDGLGMTSISVDGFLEVYQSGTQDMNIGASHRFKIATLPAIVLLKLIAFDDRPENRMKDARDIANIIFHYFDLQADFIYANHSDIFDRDTRALDDITLQEISGIVIGREIRRIAGKNTQLQNRLSTILKSQSDLAENSAFLRNMVEETQKTLEEVTKWVSAMLQGLS